ncbi:hypothetical protein EON64_07440 [archaeon]|nr:MAG: hypothetical protein EON64_07440 [archaeon]
MGRLGYYASLRCTLSGLCMISEVSVGCFLRGGNLVSVMANVGNYRDEADMIRDSKGLVNSGHQDAAFGLPRSRLSQMESTLKGAKVKLLHLRHNKKFKSFGPAANHPDSSFEYDDEQVTVAEYFERMAKSDPRYSAALPSGRLYYPHLPTLHIGTKKHVTLVPVELVFVTEGQSRQRGLPADIANNIIRYAAQAPEDRFENLINRSGQDGILRSLQDDPNAAAFGLHGVSSKPMKVQACILPPPKLQYGNRVIEPQLKGAWNLSGGVRFAHPAVPFRGDSRIKYGLIITCDRSEPSNCDFLITDFKTALERESEAVGMPLEQIQSSPLAVRGNQRDLDEAMGYFKQKGARIVVCLLMYDCYPLLKLVADLMKLPTQCVTWKNFNKPPRNYHTSLLVKMNYKLGGVNHTLASRAPRTSRMEEEDTFQSPPKSISWFFDEPCMVLVSEVLITCIDIVCKS